MKKIILLFATFLFSGSIFSQHHLIEKKLSYAVTSISVEDIGKINVTTPIDLLAKDIFSAGVKILPEGKKEKRYCKKQAGLVR